MSWIDHYVHSYFLLFILKIPVLVEVLNTYGLDTMCNQMIFGLTEHGYIQKCVLCFWFNMQNLIHLWYLDPMFFYITSSRLNSKMSSILPFLWCLTISLITSSYSCEISYCYILFTTLIRLNHTLWSIIWNYTCSNKLLVKKT